MGARNLTSMGRLSAWYRREFALRLANEDWAAEAKVRPPTYGALIVIDTHGPISQREVSEAVGLHPSDMVDLMDLLEGNGWVARERDPADRRRYNLTLTDAGREALTRFDAVAFASEAAVLSALSPEERAQLGALVEKVLRARDDARAALVSSSGPRRSSR